MTSKQKTQNIVMTFLLEVFAKTGEKEVKNQNYELEIGGGSEG